MRDKRLSIMEIRGERVSGGRGRTWERKSYVDPHSSPPLTVKFRRRSTTPDRRRGRTLSPSARGAKQTTPHGPLQRKLGCRPWPKGSHLRPARPNQPPPTGKTGDAR